MKLLMNLYPSNWERLNANVFINLNFSSVKNGCIYVSEIKFFDEFANRIELTINYALRDTY